MSVSDGQGTAYDAAALVVEPGAGELTPEQHFASARMLHALGVRSSAVRALEGQQAKLAKLDEARTGVELAVAEAQAQLAAADAEVAAAREAVAEADAGAPSSAASAATAAAEQAQAEVEAAQQRLAEAQARLSGLEG